jgi:hypothetical protein
VGNSNELKKVTYSGVGGEVRLWVERYDYKGGVDITADGNSPIRSYSANLEPVGTFTTYQIAKCDGNSKEGCSGVVNELVLPQSMSYHVHCDVTSNQNKCSGFTICKAESYNADNSVDCLSKLNTYSCGESDNDYFYVSDGNYNPEGGFRR